MQGKILIVDPIATNRIVLKTKLTAAFYDVRQATCVAEALKHASLDAPDLVITAFDLEDADATALLEGLARPANANRIPVIALGDTEDAALRQLLLSRGAQDVLVKPVEDSLLLSRVRSMIRLYHSTERWQIRAEASRAFGLADPPASFRTPGHIQLVGTDKSLNHVWATQLRHVQTNRISVRSTRDAMTCLADGAMPDLFVLILTEDAKTVKDQMHLISTIRANADTRHCGIIAVQTSPDSEIAANALDLGADDIMPHGFNLTELHLRLSALLARKRQIDKIRASVDLGLREAIIDPLTGLYNRRYALAELARQTRNATPDDLPFAVMMADMDHFKRINDQFGHASGDAVLVETARRLRAQLRPCDTAARIGGEEFLLLLPATSEQKATAVAHRLCRSFKHVPFVIPGSRADVTVTISIGVCMFSGGYSDTPDLAGRLVDRADKALYAAKSRGRNCVLLTRPAA